MRSIQRPSATQIRNGSRLATGRRAFWQAISSSRLCGSLAATCIALALASLLRPTRADDVQPDSQVQAAREAFFEQDVRPLLAKNCYSCHGEKKQKGGLRLDSLEMVLKGGESGPAVVPGKPADSLLVEAVNFEGPEMPPTGKLAPQQIAVLTRWVSLGAPWPGRDRSAHAAALSPRPPLAKISAGDRAFWSFQPVRRVVAAGASRAPVGARARWPQNAIDEFILKALLEHGLTPAAEADKVTLIRRVTYDLTGLPPTPDEVDAFLTDDSAGAYERIVDRLLASPRYGERWGRHWLDLVRYAESDGYRQDAFRPHAWRYRDYVVSAFNTDKPYDRFLTEQLAGDELDPDDPELRVATGYLRMGTYEYNQRNVRGQWSDFLNDITDVTGEVFLGLSIGCARCHDHKFDPILQRDYYRLQAFFAAILPRDDLTLAKAQEQSRFLAQRTAWEKAAAEILRQIAAIEQPYRDKGSATALAKFPDDIKAILQKPEPERSVLERQLGPLAYRQVAYEHSTVPAMLRGEDKVRWQKLQEALKQYDALRPVPPGTVLAVTDVGPVAPATYLPGERRQEVIEPGFLSVLDPAPARIERPAAAERSTGRRLALARWLCEPDNPLTARVIVNRLWQYHIGRGLVGTSSDFGHLGKIPSHPELLDWLASELVARGWHLKPLHRLILTSKAYRQSAHRLAPEIEQARAIDPENRLLWKRTVQRLDAEEIRDAMLATSGELGQALGGPSVPAAQPRRTIDTRSMRNLRDTLLDAFDAPDGNATAALRSTTTTATQALLLINGEWTIARARALAARLERAVPAASVAHDRVVLAYRLAFGRRPLTDELARAIAFLDRQSGLAGPSRKEVGSAALMDFCHVLLNSNEFLYVD
jgi:mono/diheme cytochrome c family protein